MHLEDGLRLGAEGYGRFKRVLDAVAAEELEQVGWVLVDDNVGAGDVDSESVGEEFFFFLGVSVGAKIERPDVL